MIITTTIKFRLNVPTKPVNISLDEELVGPLTKDKGPASMSGFINYILGIVYSQPLYAELEKYRKKEGLRNIPEAAEELIRVGLKK